MGGPRRGAIFSKKIFLGKICEAPNSIVCESLAQKKLPTLIIFFTISSTLCRASLTASTVNPRPEGNTTAATPDHIISGLSTPQCPNPPDRSGVKHSLPRWPPAPGPTGWGIWVRV